MVGFKGKCWEVVLKYIILLIPCVLAVLVPFYNSVEPTLLGFPFFYWFILLLVPVSVGFIYAADKMGAGK